MIQIELGLQIPSEVEQALKEEAKKQELLKTFIDSGALTVVEDTIGKININDSGALLNGWSLSVAYYKQDKRNYYEDDEPHNPGILLSFVKDEEETSFINYVSMDYYETGETRVRGSKNEFPVIRNRPNRPNTFMEYLRERLGGKLSFDVLDWYFGDKNLFVDGNLNSDLQGAIANAFSNPGRYTKNALE